MLAKITTKGKFCATRNIWTTANSIVTYDNLTFSETNMEGVTQPPLDIDTGRSRYIKLFWHGYANICSGIFTVPEKGTWRVRYSFWSSTDENQRNVGALYQNDNKIGETEYRSLIVGATGMWETGGKEALFNAEKEDTFYLKTERNDNTLRNIITCFEFVSV